MNRVRQSTHPDQLWHGKVVCRQYVQGYCSYGAKCKYDHPPVGERWFGHQPLPLPPQTKIGGYWPSFQDANPIAYTENQYNDDSQHLHQYSMASRLLSNNAFICGTKTPQAHHTSSCADPKKIRSIIAWKTTPCKHFVKNNGWCPLGDGCNFIHDWDLVQSTMWNRDIIRQTAESSSRPDGSLKATSHCWAHVQGFCGARNCPHFHPVDIQPYIKYTPCPAWILCDRRSTCPFKHFDVSSRASQESEHLAAPGPPPPPPVFYAPPPPPIIYTPPAPAPPPNPVEVNGTTYFPIAQDNNNVSEEYHYPTTAPRAFPATVPSSAPITAPVPIPVTTSFQYEPIIPPPISPPPSYHYIPQAYPPHGEHSFLEQIYVTESPPLGPPLPAPMPIMVPGGMNLNCPDITSVGHGVVLDPVSVPGSEPDPAATTGISAGMNQESRRPKRRLNGHVRRISINVKTGEIVERTLEGRHGVYGL